MISAQHYREASLVANLEYFNSKLISEGKSRAIREKELWLEKDRQVAVFNKKRQKEPKNKLKKELSLKHIFIESQCQSIG